MLIEFYLPPERSGLLPHQVRNYISRELNRWAKQHNISYQEKTVKLVHRICFDDDRYYAFFNLTWAPGQEHWWYNYRIISNRNNPV